MKRTLAALGAIMVVVALLGYVWLFVSDTRVAGSELTEARREYNLLQCLGDLSLKLIPDDDVVFVAWYEGGRANYWNQRLIELTSPERLVTNHAARADLILTLVRYEGGTCSGYDLDVTAP